LVFLLNKADKVVFLNQAHVDLLVSHGLQQERTVVMHIASDAEMFTPHERTGKGKVVISMGYYERKNPTLLAGIIKAMPHRCFILIGKDWGQFDAFDEMKALENFEYFDSIPYEDYPKLYGQCDVFLSTSRLEGGPVPLLETMLCNIVPVASSTGFCVDIINHGENGFLFGLDATVDEVVPMIESAYRLKANTRECVIGYTWQNSAEKIDRLFD
jgi:glycosyltransferase involved in cell wall biosynthesis